MMQPNFGKKDPLLLKQFQTNPGDKRQEAAQGGESSSQENTPRRKRRQHRHPVAEPTSLQIGGAQSEPSSPRRARALVQGTANDRQSMGLLLTEPKNLLASHRPSQLGDAGKAITYGLDKPAGLSAQETEKLRDLQHNFAVDTNNRRRWQHTIENERGGVFEREENGAKRIFLPANGGPGMEQYAQFHRNKNRHQSHIRLDDASRANSIERQAPSPGKEQMSPAEARGLAQLRIQYIP